MTVTSGEFLLLAFSTIRMHYFFYNENKLKNLDPHILCGLYTLSLFLKGYQGYNNSNEHF